MNSGVLFSLVVRWTAGLMGCLIFLSPAVADAQPWAGIIAPGRATAWTDAGKTGGVPSATWTRCGSVIAAYNGTAGTINNAISACGANQFVELGPGTFNLSTGIVWKGKSNVALRGQGADQTKLIFTGRDGCGGQQAAVCFNNANGNLTDGGNPTKANWTAGYARGTSNITVSTIANLKVGRHILLDQVDLRADNGGVLVTSDGCCTDEGGSGAQNRTTQERSQQEFVKVTACGTSTPGAACTSNTLTISPPILYPNWSSGQSPAAVWSGDELNNAGVENLSIDFSNAGGATAIAFFNAYECWVKGVRTIVRNTSGPQRNHVWLWTAAFITIRDSYFFGCQTCQSQGYGIEWYLAGRILAENNIFEHTPAPFSINGGAAGSVIGYNYSFDEYWTVDLTAVNGQQWNHAAGNDFVLTESNDGNAYFSDDIHGTHVFNTVFRNRYTGLDPAWPTRTNQATPILIKAFGRYYNLIGNVLGTSGFHQVYACIYPSGCGSEPTIEAGYHQNSQMTVDDPLVGTTLMRWGNYETATGSTHFTANEVPSGLSDYPNPVPSSQTLPASFYLSAKPTWFGNIPYPAIGPDVTGGNISGVGGHANKIPARTCYESLSLDPNYGAQNGNRPKVFNALVCYGAGSALAPMPPVGLSLQ